MIKKFLEHYKTIDGVRLPTPGISCRDGFTMSVQVGSKCKCLPHGDDEDWTHVEVIAPSELDPLLLSYSEHPGMWGRAYTYVPVRVVDEIIAKHGGIVAAYFGDQQEAYQEEQ